LGFAGLLPQIAAVQLILLGRRDPTDLAWIPVFSGYMLALGYGASILSFIGGMWWMLAMRRSVHQGRLAAMAVVPSLLGMGLVTVAPSSWPAGLATWPAVAMGLSILATLVVDRQLVRTGEAPAGWMALRIPLSLGLGMLTIAAGMLVAR
jgi:hypothetical protein